MRASRFFVEGIYEEGATVALDCGDAHKILHVLRLGTGDAIRIVDSSGSEFEATVAEDPDGLVARVTARVATNSAGGSVALTIAQAIPKAQKMEYVVEKASELGVASIVPFASERTVVREFSENKVERWRRVARSSAEQCGRSHIMEVAEPVSFAELLCRFGAYDVVLFPWEGSDPEPLRDVMPALLARAKRVMAVIGPEGGFSHGEAAGARDAGARVVSLGTRILRTETAGLYVAAVVDFLTAT
ncbi:MAG: 16S rRNA (uracil(1498)-N(3))-methyltransferase [Candidatus Eremiobacteraeota bacterium]|nr:16S rRNA (uracil(1498)-N(3))-methyltransferase [Candidatus Eremiobacteraeota bacterium]